MPVSVTTLMPEANFHGEPVDGFQPIFCGCGCCQVDVTGLCALPVSVTTLMPEENFHGEPVDGFAAATTAMAEAGRLSKGPPAKHGRGGAWKPEPTGLCPCPVSELLFALCDDAAPVHPAG